MSESATNATTAAAASSIIANSPYHYIPTEGVCITFIVLFGLATAAFFFSAIRFRLWWLLPTACLAGIGEIVGWAGRLWSSLNYMNSNAFLAQITCTIIAPTPFLAACFIIFSALSQRLGPAYSRLSPRWYSRIFLTCDIIALVIQGTGGGIASSADDDSTQNLGSNIMLAGIVFQLVALSIFMSLMAEFYWRFLTTRPFGGVASNSSASTLYISRHWNTKLKLMSAALSFSTVTLFIRSIYRVIELAGGWNGRIISTQVYFNVLDGAMVVLAMYSLAIINPGYFLYRDAVEESDMLEKDTPTSTPRETY
ncbi:hypothetical protein PHLGIDRAFT_30017 [Phlebiopsis gigantea 11061_1 CR5-6]|uniref:RTA1 like protein n=1 Tax=Phlebiopsis gigantea (strain 11061_1 CR5-6) TaxID=745531 RepID=A0A0C3SAY6_PHLG1|nr:hypothetical protein PHLGIDRAFT_30017 [Phlebiopsis gigantea 11061_1 CR5-6]